MLTLHLSPSLKKGLKTQVMGQTMHFFREIPSTNDMAKELALIGAKEGTVVAAAAQTQGKGRLGREWISPAGGLWVSVILRPKVSPEHAPRLTLLAAVAVAKTLGKLYNLKPEVKWPNDVLIDGKKVCGILTEASTKGKCLDFVVIGFGINANFPLNRLPASLHCSTTTLQEELGKEVNLEALLRSLLEEAEYYYWIFSKGNFEAVLTEWKRFAKFLGSYVYVTSLSEKVEGWAIDVDEQGALIVKLKDQTTRRIVVGDVTVRVL
jgi:BirA family biotin operon repressor/biotin-[acetyl-CoA-carboxylase] ligase